MNKITVLKNIIEAQNLDKIFEILQNEARINSLAIYEKNGDDYDLKYSYGHPLKINEELNFPLNINGVEWAKLVVSNDIDDIEFLELISVIISEKIQTQELKSLMTKQISLLQEGIINHEGEVNARTTFFAKVTHDLRTPLSSILGYCGLLREEVAGKLNKIQKNYLLDIESSAVNLLNIINDILDFSKISAKKSVLNATTFDIKQAFFEAENIVKPLLIKKNQKLNVIVENFSVNADYQKTLQIIINLLSNSIKYSPENSQILLRSEVSNNVNIIEVKDEGIGIPKKALKGIFRAFKQGKNKNNSDMSTGLGLTIVQNFVKMHNWQIEINSEENLGTVVKIYVS